MEVVRRLSPDAAEWLMRKPPHKWSRSAFATDSKNPALTSNFYEQFNAMIMKYRGKPIITMVEGIRAYITSKMVRSQKLLAKYNGQLCPKVQSKLYVMRERSRFWLPQLCGDPEAVKYEVSCPPHSKCVVNLQERTCSCREWDLSGIPCVHAIACMGNVNYKPEDFVHSLLTKPVNQSIYSHYINPCPGEAFWQRTLLNPVLPPKYKRPPGRPKKQRRKAPEEVLDKKNPHKLKRKLGPPTCSRCGVEGHTRKTCKGVGESSSSRPANEEEEEMEMNANTAAPQPTQPSQSTQPSQPASVPHQQMFRPAVIPPQQDMSFCLNSPGGRAFRPPPIRPTFRPPGVTPMTRETIEGVSAGTGQRIAAFISPRAPRPPPPA